MRSDQYETEVLTLEPTSPASIAPGEIVIGVFTAMDNHGQPLVSFNHSPTDEPVVALSTVGLKPRDVGRQLALLFANGDLNKPVVIGLIHSPLDELLNHVAPSTNDDTATPVLNDNAKEYTIDSEKVVLEGKREVVLKCGEASITLTQSGKILICGKYLLNRSNGVNHIMGGSIQLN